jgi:hypothetical protein
MMEYLVFGVVLFAGASAIAGLITHIRKDAVIANEDDTASYRLLKEYALLFTASGDLCDKFEARELLQARIIDHLNQVKIKREQKKQQGVIIRLTNYWKKK